MWKEKNGKKFCLHRRSCGEGKVWGDMWLIGGERRYREEWIKGIKEALGGQDGKQAMHVNPLIAVSRHISLNQGHRTKYVGIQY